ncbi:hypothetical protein FVE85_3333 [Porphyridium purpureum]|uniref:MYND-type domain-containing protein n=1 Tax=Porphyridium purpureum TaxID=35688 RepID=A0A5J4YW94_PORPP|nr:hypothetical protein FVE85_3333 [Porphyridium purpureum]|eukprot:POR8547..scf227_4
MYISPVAWGAGGCGEAAQRKSRMGSGGAQELDQWEAALAALETQLAALKSGSGHEVGAARSDAPDVGALEQGSLCNDAEAASRGAGNVQEDAHRSAAEKLSAEAFGVILSVLDGMPEDERQVWAQQLEHDEVLGLGATLNGSVSAQASAGVTRCAACGSEVSRDALLSCLHGCVLVEYCSASCRRKHAHAHARRCTARRYQTVAKTNLYDQRVDF